MKWLCSLTAFFFLSSAFGQDPLSFLFVGDVMQHDGQIEAAHNPVTGGYDYDDGYKFVEPILQQYDIRIANLEVTLAGPPYKGYPQFSAPDELASTLVNSGFNVIITANNHSCDRGSKGVERTLDELDRLGVKHTGTFRSQEERDKNYPLILEEKGMKVAVLNYTYGTNGLSVNPPLIINYIDSAVIKKDVERAKELNADYIICTMHWGTEYKFLPNGYQKRFESYCYDLGVDMVIGGHPHTVQPIERKTVQGEEKLTVWSLGNFVSNMQTRPTRGGLMVGASIVKKDKQVKLNSAEYYLVYVLKRKEGAVTQYYILPDFDYNTHQADFVNSTDMGRMNDFLSDSRKLFSEHNIGVQEKRIADDSPIATLYQKYLNGYYAVELINADEKLLRNPEIGNMFHLTVDKTGKRHLLTGVCSSVEQTSGLCNYARDLMVAEKVKPVEVKNGQIIEMP